MPSSFRRRPGDDIVEPLFAALSEPTAEENLAVGAVAAEVRAVRGMGRTGWLALLGLLASLTALTIWLA